MLIIRAVSVSALTGVVGAEVQPAPRVRVTTDDGLPASGITVIFEASANGVVVPNAVNSDAEGYASPGRWILGTQSGEQTLSATIGAGTVVFRTVVAPGPPTRFFRYGGDKQSGFSSDTLPERLRVRMVDQYGNGIVREAVTFVVNSGGGSIDATVMRTDSLGVVVSGPWTLGSSGGEQRVTATSGIGSLDFTAQACDAACQANQIAYVRGGCIFQVPFRSTVDPIGLVCSGRDYTPSWSPDGQWLAFVRLRPDPPPPGAMLNWNTEVWLFNAAQKSTHRFMAGHSPAWSSDGTRLAVSRGDCVYRCTSFVVAVNDTSARLSLPADAAFPVMSPDGTRIAYVSLSGDDGYHALHLVNADKSGFREITLRDEGGIFFPSWSPHSDRLVFTKCIRGSCDLYSVRADGTDGGALRRLTSGLRVFYPKWSPDGQWILFTSFTDEVPEGYLAYMEADGGGAATVLFTNGTQPVWRPVRR